MADDAEIAARVEAQVKTQIKEEIKDMKDQIAMLTQMMTNFMMTQRQTPVASMIQPPAIVDPQASAQSDGALNGMPPLEDVLLGAQGDNPPLTNVPPSGVQGVTQPPGNVILPAPQIATPTVPRVTTGMLNDESAKLLAKFDQRLREIEGTHHVSPIDLSMYAKVQVPDKFKLPEFEKYDGTSNPVEHVRMYQARMTKYVTNDLLMVQTFQASPKGPAMRWYTNHHINRIETWEKTAAAFIKHFGFNLDITISREDPEQAEMKKGETVKQDATRWRNLAARLMPEPSERELMKLFVSTLPQNMRSHILGASARSFSQLISMAEEVESGLKKGWYGDFGSSGKQFFGKKDKEAAGEVNVAYAQKFPVQAPKATMATQQTVNYGHENQRQQFRPKRQFTPLPGTPSQVLAILRKKNLLTSDPQRPNYASFPKYDPTKKCDYHSGEPGHSTDDCMVLKNRIQDLLETGAFAFQSAGQPNVRSNPLPNHVSN
ncbi:uncharacterized protein LOC115732442 [Rhodamnia argentea]|uniref:Uncharacterized protein LOC115732442 n=1 Tax=Rhodamnia argentea TaxID=178133 RepID=A0A8B8NAE8_9MYRT|nr:uncharacterized protein LOC115732442 [Rhodamnia argentea]